MNARRLCWGRLQPPLTAQFSPRAVYPAFRSIAAHGLVGSLLVAAVMHPANADEAATRNAGLEFFERRIRPLLIEHCYECHSSEEETEGGLKLDSRDAIRRGGDSGAAIIPGDPSASLLLRALRYEDLEMPPDKKLSDAVVADFEKWIAIGAPDPREAPPDAVGQHRNLPDSPPVASDHWALQPLTVHPPPVVQNTAWPQGAIDRFVLARLEQHHLRPIHPAPPEVLVRRLYFDLTGLPPTVPQLEYWSAKIGVTQKTLTTSQDQVSQVSESGELDPDAVAELVDHLLGSPHFGERWARHWLDLARFSESNGGDRNVIWPHAWRYRNWVIDALNADYPYDQFLRDQLAGDLLPAETSDERDRQLVATGLLTLGPKLFMETESERFRMDVVDEQIDVVSRSMLGLTVSCARCHDHKFDPISTRDYYALAGIFRSTYLLYGTAAPAGNEYGHDRPLQPIGPHAMELHGPAEAWQKAVGEQTARRNKARSDRYRVVRQKAADENRLQMLQQGKSAEEQAADEGIQELLTAIESQTAEIAEWDARIAQLDEELKQLEDHPPPFPAYAMAVRDDADPSDCTIRIGGRYDDQSEAVPRDAWSLLEDLPMPPIAAGSSGRIELAQWITDERNPLTPRVAVNRVWQHLFGEGLVRTADNFGVLGEPPSHPELLDFLADELTRDGWSIKRLVRRIVLSRTYWLASASPGDGDPANRWLSHMRVRRLEVEPLRDAMLAVSGQLRLTPPAGSVVSQFEETEFNDRVRLSEDQLSAPHRSIYLPLVRTDLPGMFSTFDFADPSLIVGRREARTMADQQLFFLNSPFVIRCADAAAERLLTEPHLNEGQRVDLAFRRFFGRRATEAQRDRVLAFVQSLQPTANDPAGEQMAWSQVCQAFFASAEWRLLQ